MAAGRAGRIAIRVLRVIGLTLAGVVGLAGLAYAALTLTPTGRATIRDIALHETNALLAGKLQVAEITRVGLRGLSLQDAEARDPSGAVVLRVKSIAIDLAPLRLLAGEIAATRVAISGAEVQLADLGERRGVIAAFMPREPSQEPEQPERRAAAHLHRRDRARWYRGDNGARGPRPRRCAAAGRARELHPAR